MRFDLCVITLTSNLTTDLSGLKHMSSSMDRYLPKHTPLFVFNEGNLGSFKLKMKRDVFYPTVQFHDPQNIPYIWSKRSKYGYLHMIKFFFADIFHHTAMKACNYYMRLDTDSCLLGPLPTSLMKNIKQESHAYIANDKITDCGPYVQDLSKHVTQFQKTQNISADLSYMTDKCVGGYFNNFEIVHLNTFRQSKTHNQFTDFILNSNGIYLHRWGDAILRRLDLDMMMVTNSTITINLAKHYGIQYKHECSIHPRPLVFRKGKLVPIGPPIG